MTTTRDTVAGDSGMARGVAGMERVEIVSQGWEYVHGWRYVWQLADGRRIVAPTGRVA